MARFACQAPHQLMRAAPATTKPLNVSPKKGGPRCSVHPVCTPSSIS